MNAPAGFAPAGAFFALFLEKCLTFNRLYGVV
jgi:hypothetical protein